MKAPNIWVSVSGTGDWLKLTLFMWWLKKGACSLCGRVLCVCDALPSWISYLSFNCLQANDGDKGLWSPHKQVPPRPRASKGWHSSKETSSMAGTFWLLVGVYWETAKSRKTLGNNREIWHLRRTGEGAETLPNLIICC